MSGDQQKHPYVLVVEDDAPIRSTLALIFGLKKIASVSVANGAEALEFLAGAECLPTLILLDLRMPVMDGETFRQHQLALPAICSIPTVLLSADTHVKELAVTMGISQVLIKPFSQAALAGILHEYL